MFEVSVIIIILSFFVNSDDELQIALTLECAMLRKGIKQYMLIHDLIC